MSAPPGAVWASNDREYDGRLLVIVLDDLDRTRFHRVRRTVLALLKHLGPGDQVAMLSNGGSPTYQVEFTTDTSRVVRALDSRAVLGVGRDRLLRVLTRVADALRPVSGRRKIVAVVSEGVPEIARSLQIGEENQLPDLQEFLTAALRANVAVYAFNPQYAFNLDGMVHAETLEDRGKQLQGERDGNVGLQTIAEATGGRATVRSNVFEAEVARMFEESGSYYLVAYHSNAPADGRFHQISVRSRRPGVELRTKSGFLSPRSPSPTQQGAPVDRLVSAPVQASGLPLRVVAVAAPSSSTRVASVFIMVEMDGSHLVRADGVEVKAVGVDRSGRIRAADRFTGRLQVPLRDEDSRWMRVGLSLDLPPGNTNCVSPAARTDGAALGSVFDEIEVPDFRGDLALGALILGTTAGSGMTAADPVISHLGLVPIAARELTAQMNVRASIPAQVSRRHRLAAVRFVATLLGPDGATRELVRTERPAAPFTSGGAFDFALALEGLTPGEYQLRLNATLGKISADRWTSFRVRP